MKSFRKQQNAMPGFGALVICGAALLLFFSTAGAGPIPEQLIRQTPRRAEAELTVSAPGLVTRVKNGERIIFIDIRTAADFEALHIPGAMNIPLAFIKTKDQLKSAPLVVVGRGLCFQRLAPACRGLRQKGFNVRIMDGGMNAWSRCGGPMVGEPANRIGWDEISPADFFLEKDDPRRIVCDVSALRTPEVEALMPYAVHLPLDGDPQKKTGQLEAFKATRHCGPNTVLLVVNADGQGYPNLAPVFDRAGMKHVFYLQGGTAAYAQYLEGLTRSWRPGNARRLVVNPCRQCGEKQETESP